MLFAMRLCEEGGMPAPLALYTFAEPMVGDAAFTRRWGSTMADARVTPPSSRLFVYLFSPVCIGPLGSVSPIG